MNNESQPSPLTFSIFAPAKIDIFLNGDFNKDILPELNRNILDAEELIRFEARAQKVSILLDMTNFSGAYDVECMEAMVSFMKANNEFVAKTAVYGATDKAELVTEVTAAFAGRENIKVFHDREEAIAWLQS